MLFATYRNKTGLPGQRYATQRKRADDPRKTQEDELTSTIFGPLALMPPETAYRFWKFLVGELPGDVNGCKVSTELWPRTGTKEPDLRARLEDHDSHREVIVVEVKWNAPLHERQLPDQWRESFNAAERKTGWHVFIGKSTSQATSSEQRHARLRALTWLDFVDLMEHKIPTDSDEVLKQWAKLVVAFLRACGIKKFEGFGRIEADACLDGFGVPAGPIFWEGWKGWRNVPDVIFPSLNDSSIPLFFTKGANS